MAGFSDWLKKNTSDNAKMLYGGKIGGAFLGLDLAHIATSDNKLKELLKTLGRLLLFKPLFAGFLAGAFSGMSKAVRSLVHDTGSLEAYLKKLTQIQGLQRVFAPLVGGADAAKRKVAELVNFSARFGQNLGEVGEAARGLQIYTRGAYAGASALKTVADAASATGNGLVETGDAVGEFYAALRNGEPIGSAAEKLRGMGVINDATATSLVSLQENGAGAARVFDELTGALGQHAGGMEAFKESLAGVASEHERLATELQEKFASPFAADEIENTKNMNEAMAAVAPTVGSVAEWLEKLTGGFSTAESWMAKTAAQSPVLRGSLELMVKVLTGLIAVVSTVAGVGLGAWLIGAAGAAATAAAALIGFTGATGAAATAITALGVAVRVAAIATGIGAIVIALATAAGIIYNFVRSSEAQKKALEDFRKANDETARSLDRQIGAIKTLADRYEALSATLDAVTDAQLALNKAQAEGNPEKIALAKKALEERKKQQEKVEGRPTAPSTQAEEALRAEVERKRQEGERSVELEMSTATPERKAELLRQRILSDYQREAAARRGVQARVDFVEQGAKAGEEVTTAQKELDRLRKEQSEAPRLEEVSTVKRSRINPRTGEREEVEEPAPKFRHGVPVAPPTRAVELAGEIEEAESALHEARAKAGRLGTEADRDSSVYFESQARAATDPAQRADLLRKAEERRQEEGNVGALSERQDEDSAALTQMNREQSLAEARAKIEREIAELKSHGADRADEEYTLRQKLLDAELAAERQKVSPDQARLDQLEGEKAQMQQELVERHRAEGAQKGGITRSIEAAEARRQGTAAGDETAVNLANLSKFAEHFEEMRGLYGDDEARSKALALTRGDLEEHAGGVVASSLARIGGGGGTYDPLIDVQKQIKDLTQQSVEYLKQMSEKMAEEQSADYGGPDLSRPE